MEAGMRRAIRKSDPLWKEIIDRIDDKLVPDKPDLQNMIQNNLEINVTFVPFKKRTEEERAPRIGKNMKAPDVHGNPVARNAMVAPLSHAYFFLQRRHRLQSSIVALNVRCAQFARRSLLGKRGEQLLCVAIILLLNELLGITKPQ